MDLIWPRTGSEVTCRQISAVEDTSHIKRVHLIELSWRQQGGVVLDVVNSGGIVRILPRPIILRDLTVVILSLRTHLSDKQQDETR